MPTKNVRVSAYVFEELARYLRQRAIESDTPVGALLRRAVRLMQFADAKKEVK